MIKHKVGEPSHEYRFMGSVLLFGVVIAKDVRYATTCMTEDGAINNIKYKFKIDNGMSPRRPVQLSGTLRDGSGLTKKILK